MANGIQTVVAQQAVQISPGSFGSGCLTGIGEEFLTGLHMERCAKGTGTVLHKGKIVKEEGAIKVNCEFCKKEYVFTDEDVDKMVNKR